MYTHYVYTIVHAHNIIDATCTKYTTYAQQQYLTSKSTLSLPRNLAPSGLSMLFPACRRPHFFHFTDVFFHITCHKHRHNTSIQYQFISTWYWPCIFFMTTLPTSFLMNQEYLHAIHLHKKSFLHKNDPWQPCQIVTTYIHKYIIISIIQSSYWQTTIYIHTYIYKHRHNHDHDIITNINSSQHSQDIWHLKYIYFTFSSYLSHVCTTTVHLPLWTN